MAIDHGLGGRENDKGKEKRKKKAARRKTEILRTIVENPKELKKEVVFNEAARADWLTGFNKRKQKRRQYGIAMQCLKEKKQLKDAQTQKRERQKKMNAEYHEAATGGASEGGSNENEEEVEEEASAVAEEPAPSIVFEDAHTHDMFGSSVSVTIDSTGIAEELDQFRSSYTTNDGDEEEDDNQDDAASVRSNNHSSSNSNKNSRIHGEEKTYKQKAFDKAIKAAKSMIESRKHQKKAQKIQAKRSAEGSGHTGGRGNNMSRNKKTQMKQAVGKKLFTKAIGHKARKK